MDTKAYVWTARIWAVVFFLVGLGFALRPEATGSDLTAIANLFGVSGQVVSGPVDLWWVLTLSLMATITVLATWCSLQPQNAAPFVALMTAKLTSTAVFLILALTFSPAWLTGAVGDGFVALTLWLARRRARPALGTLSVSPTG